MTLVEIAQRLAKEVDRLSFDLPVAAVYNPLHYAWQPHRLYLERYGGLPGRYLLVGMNPGPWGMAQTGVPFGEVQIVRDWLGIEGEVERPENEHPKKSVDGFECSKSEVSGRRLWGWARRRYESPEKFFQHFFVGNYCPLLFLEKSGRNRTPDKLRVKEREQLFAVCDQALADSVQTLKPTAVIGVGKFAFERAKLALKGQACQIASISHPSPANPQANRGWEALIENQLEEIGITF